MRNYSTLSPTFWTGVINYIGTSAVSAEVPLPEKQLSVTPISSVFVFKTSVNGEADMKNVTGGLTNLLGTGKWTIDLDDEDKVLRVVSSSESKEHIISILNAHGFSCELMPY